jgi:hypothetical protein
MGTSSIIISLPMIEEDEIVIDFRRAGKLADDGRNFSKTHGKVERGGEDCGVE